jgi:hypothetical protein
MIKPILRFNYSKNEIKFLCKEKLPSALKNQELQQAKQIKIQNNQPVSPKKCCQMILGFISNAKAC